MSCDCITPDDVRDAIEHLRLSNRLEESGTPQDLIERGAILALETLLHAPGYPYPNTGSRWNVP